eukprot:augustus_masked-scaffold_12-processed-gene-6.47-mRNA-1 protein AED:1.00 eAED:1.00 QI:0/0/0/0/1/1/2/0/834
MNNPYKNHQENGPTRQNQTANVANNQDTNQTPNDSYVFNLMSALPFVQNNTVPQYQPATGFYSLVRPFSGFFSYPPNGQLSLDHFAFPQYHLNQNQFNGNPFNMQPTFSTKPNYENVGELNRQGTDYVVPGHNFSRQGLIGSPLPGLGSINIPNGRSINMQCRCPSAMTQNGVDISTCYGGHATSDTCQNRSSIGAERISLDRRNYPISSRRKKQKSSSKCPNFSRMVHSSQGKVTQSSVDSTFGSGSHVTLQDRSVKQNQQLLKCAAKSLELVKRNSVKSKSTSSRYSGVSWHGRDKCYMGRISMQLKHHYVGVFKAEMAAALAVDEKLLGQNPKSHKAKKVVDANLNFKNKLERDLVRVLLAAWDQLVPTQVNEMQGRKSSEDETSTDTLKVVTDADLFFGVSKDNNGFPNSLEEVAVNLLSHIVERDRASLNSSGSTDSQVRTAKGGNGRKLIIFSNRSKSTSNTSNQAATNLSSETTKEFESSAVGSSVQSGSDYNAPSLIQLVKKASKLLQNGTEEYQKLRSAELLSKCLKAQSQQIKAKKFLKNAEKETKDKLEAEERCILEEKQNFKKKAKAQKEQFRKMLQDQIMRKKKIEEALKVQSENSESITIFSKDKMKSSKQKLREKWLHELRKQETETKLLKLSQQQALDEEASRRASWLKEKAQLNLRIQKALKSENVHNLGEQGGKEQELRKERTELEHDHSSFFRDLYRKDKKTERKQHFVSKNDVNKKSQENTESTTQGVLELARAEGNSKKAERKQNLKTQDYLLEQILEKRHRIDKQKLTNGPNKNKFIQEYRQDVKLSIGKAVEEGRNIYPLKRCLRNSNKPS